MSITTEITRIQDARNVIRTKLVELGMVQSTADIDDCATAVEGIENRGAVSANIQEGDTYTIPKGYHNGSGTVSGVAGGGNYSLQSKTVTPTKSQQNVTPDSGYYGISDVTVAAIPENYQDVTPVTAGAADVLANKIIVDATGKSIAGTMPNNGKVAKTLKTTDKEFTIPAGYHDGTGKVIVASATTEATPTKETQTLKYAAGTFIEEITVHPIPDNYVDTTDADAAAANILAGKTAYVNSVKVEGTMPNNGAVSQTLTTETLSYTIPKGYHNGSGKVRIVPETVVEVTPTEHPQNITAPEGKVLTKVYVKSIPDNYIDTTEGEVLAATAADIRYQKIAYVNGEMVIGEMPNRSMGSIVLDTSTTAASVPAGYHDGTGEVSIVLEEKSTTPTKSAQTITPTAGKVLSKVTVAAIPAAYQDVTGVTATAATVLDGSYFVTSSGVKTEGTMTNNGAVTKTIDGMTVTSYTIPAGYHSGSGTVSLTNDIETALAAI